MGDEFPITDGQDGLRIESCTLDGVPHSDVGGNFPLSAAVDDSGHSGAGHLSFLLSIQRIQRPGLANFEPPYNRGMVAALVALDFLQTTKVVAIDEDPKCLMCTKIQHRFPEDPTMRGHLPYRSRATSARPNSSKLS